MRTPYAKPQVKKREVTRPNANTHCLQDSSAALHRRPSVGSGKAREAEPTCYADGGSCEARHDSRGRRELWGKSKLCAAVINTDATRYLTVREGPTRVLRNDGGEDHAGKDNKYTVRGINRRAPSSRLPRTSGVNFCREGQCRTRSSFASGGGTAPPRSRWPLLPVSCSRSGFGAVMCKYLEDGMTSAGRGRGVIRERSRVGSWAGGGTVLAGACPFHDCTCQKQRRRWAHDLCSDDRSWASNGRHHGRLRHLQLARSPHRFSCLWLSVAS